MAINDHSKPFLMEIYIGVIILDVDVWKVVFGPNKAFPIHNTTIEPFLWFQALNDIMSELQSSLCYQKTNLNFVDQSIRKFAA